jgi:hypothetical protein
MRPKHPLVLTKRLIAVFMRFCPIAYICSELEMMRGGAVQLFEEGAEETVAIA